MRQILLFTFATVAFAGIDQPVKLDTGMLAGVPGKNAEIRVFKGIPYAAPPVGDLRWKPPQPALKWDGVRSGAEFGNSCMQGGGRGGAGAAKGGPPPGAAPRGPAT